MSAGFEVAGEVFWGTNGAVEAYIEAMAELAAERFSPNDPLATFLRDERDSFSVGKIVFLDEWLRDAADRDRLLELFDVATERLLRDGTFTQNGQQWVSDVVSELRKRIAGGTYE